MACLKHTEEGEIDTVSPDTVKNICAEAPADNLAEDLEVCKTLLADFRNVRENLPKITEYAETLSKCSSYLSVPVHQQK